MIKKIISIDQAARDIIQRSDEDIREKELATKKEIEGMKRDMVEKAKQEGQRIYDERMLLAAQKADLIREQGAARCKKLEEKYDIIKADMESSIFRRIFVDIPGEGQ